jgi:CBS domain-containing protein
MTDSKLRLDTLKAALDDIGTAGETARLQLHLLSMRARERTGELAANIEALEGRLDRGIEQAMDTAASKTRQLSSVVRDLLGQSPAPLDGQPTVKAIMTDAVQVCSPDQPLDSAARLMWEHDCGAIPVVSAGGDLTGIISDRDVCMAAYTRGLPLAAIFVRDVMARHVHTCRPEDSLVRAATLMADAQVRRLPVTDAEQRLIGIVSLADIARAAPVLGQREGAELVLALLRALSQRPHPSFNQQPQAAD